MSNKIKTQGYFIKRLRDSGYIVWKMFDKYHVSDNRKWTVLINPGHDSVYATCYVNVDELRGTPQFVLDDGGRLRRLRIKTDSIEVIVNTLIQHNITPDCTLHKKI